MQKIILILIAVLCFGALQESQAKSLRTHKKKPSISKKNALIMEKREFNRKLEESLISIAFSKKILESQSAMNFILDNPKESYKPVRELLYNSDIDSTNLMNIWNIFTYLQAENEREVLGCEEIIKIQEIQKNKIEFLSLLISTNFDRCPQDFTPSIKEWLESDDTLLYNEAFEIIKEKKLDDFAPSVLQNIVKSQNLFKQELAFSTLTVLNTKQLDVDPLLEFLASPSPILRNASSIFFSKRPEYREKLEKRFTRWFVSEQEKTAIINAMKTYEDRETFNFILQEYPKNPGQIAEMNSFFMQTNITQREFIQILDLFSDLKSTNQTLSLLNTVHALLPKFIDDFTVLNRLEKLFEKLKKEKNYAMDNQIQNIQKEIKNYSQSKKMETED